MRKPTLISAVLIFGSCLLAVSGVRAENWSRFRGPNGTGVSADKDIPVQWTDKDLLWKTAIPGRGHSSPIVWDNKVFIQSAEKDGSQRLLLCIDAKDGKIIWTQKVPGDKAKTHNLNNLAASTPATDGERVYTLFWNGKEVAVHAFDMKGEQVWKEVLGSFKSQHGAGTSPVVYGDKVYVNFDQDGSAKIVALDAKTGKLAWQKTRQAFRACYSSPFMLDKPDGGKELVVLSTAGLGAYDPKTGDESWKWVWDWKGSKEALRTVSSPVVSNGMIFGTSGSGGGSRCIFGVKLGSKTDQAKLVWDVRKTMPYVPSLLTLGDNLYWTGDKGVVGCTTAATGKEVWSENLNADFFASPVLIDGKVYAPSESGKVFVFQADTKYKLLGTSSLGESVMASPAVSNNRLFIRGDKSLFCIGKPEK